MADLRSLLAEAKASMAALKCELIPAAADDEYSSDDDHSRAPPAVAQAKKKVVPPPPPHPPRSQRRTSWIDASKGCGAEPSVLLPPPPSSFLPLRSEDGAAPGLSRDVTKLRRRAPAISFAPPAHVDPVVPKVPPPKEPITKKGKREKRERDKNLALPVYDGPLSRWQNPRNAGAPDHLETDDKSNVKGTAFAPPAHVDPVVPKVPPPKEPITKKGKRLAETAALQAIEEATDKVHGKPSAPPNAQQQQLFTVVPIDVAESGRRLDLLGKFPTAPRGCVPIPDHDRPWWKRLEEQEVAKAPVLNVAEASAAVRPRVIGGAMSMAPRHVSSKFATERQPPVTEEENVPPNTNNHKCIEVLSKHERAPVVKISPPTDRQQLVVPVKPAGMAPGPATYAVEAYGSIAATALSAKKSGEKNSSRRATDDHGDDMRPECRAILRERRAEGKTPGPGAYDVDVGGGRAVGKGAMPFGKVPNDGAVEQQRRASLPSSQQRAKSKNAGGDPTTAAESDSDFEVRFEDEEARCGRRRGGGRHGEKKDNSDDEYSTDVESSSSSSSSSSRGSSSGYDTSSSSGGSDSDSSRSSYDSDSDSGNVHSRSKRKRSRHLSSSRESRSRRDAAAARKARKKDLLKVEGERLTISCGAVSRGGIQKIAYGIHKAFFKRATDIPQGWRRLRVEEIAKRKGEIMKSIGPIDVYHLEDGRVCGVDHDPEGDGKGRIDAGIFDTFGVKKKYMKREMGRFDNEDDDDDGNNSVASRSTFNSGCTSRDSRSTYASSSVSSAQKLRRSKSEIDQLFDNMGWVLITTIEDATLSFAGKNKSRGIIFAPKQNAGVTWKNRKALVERKAQAAMESGLGVGAYNVQYSAIEKAVTATPLFAKAEEARQKEEVRRAANGALAILKAQELKAEESRQAFLASQLPQKWVDDGENSEGLIVAATSKPVFSYKEPTPLPKQAIEKRAAEIAASAVRDTYLSTQLPKDWAVEHLNEDQQPLHKNIGRDSIVVVKNNDGKAVPKRVKFYENVAELKSPTGVLRGPGKYDPFRFENIDANNDREGYMSLAVSRDDAAGPFGERPVSALLGDLADRDGLDGDRLILDVDKADRALRASAPNVVFPIAGMEDYGKDVDDGPREGDELILELGADVTRFGKRRDATLVDMSKMEDRFDTRTRRKGDDDEDVDGDNLILEVEAALKYTDKNPPNVVIGTSKRFDGGDDDDDDVSGKRAADGDVLTLSPHITPAREKVGGYGFVRDFDKMLGRNDKEQEDELIRKFDLDAKELGKAAVELELERDENIRRTITEGLVGMRTKAVTLVNMGADKSERFPNKKGNLEEDGGGDGERLELDVKWQAVKPSMNKVLVDMNKMVGREDDFDDNEPDDLGAGGEGRDGDRLILDGASNDGAIRYRPPLVGASISMQPPRWKEELKRGGNNDGICDDICVPEMIVLDASLTRFGKNTAKSLVMMSTQQGRTDRDEMFGEDDLGIQVGGVEGNNLILSPHPSVVMPSKCKGVPVIKMTAALELEQKRMRFREAEKAKATAREADRAERKRIKEEEEARAAEALERDMAEMNAQMKQMRVEEEKRREEALEKKFREKQRKAREKKEKAEEQLRSSAEWPASEGEGE